MATTVQQVVDRAIERQVANDTSLVANVAIILAWVNADQQAIFTRVADENRYFYQTVVSINSTAAAQKRQVDLADAAFVLPVERVLKIERQTDGQELFQVDLQDLDAELKPRYYQKGSLIIEVSNDWNPSAASAVPLYVYYVSRPLDLNLAGTFGQSIALPDRFADLLDNRLARRLATKDQGREVSPEIAVLDEEYVRRFNDLMAFLDHFAGVESRRFVPPRPQSKA